MTPLTEINLETGVKAAWLDWLQSYFDGAEHDVGSHLAVRFPAARVAFGQGPVSQPLSAHGGLEIRVLCLPRTERLTWNATRDDGEHLLATHQVTFQFQVRAKRPRPEDSELLADQVAQLLKAVLTNPQTRFPLARVGIAHLSPAKPSVVASTDHAMRIVNCLAHLQYPVSTGGTAPSGPVVTTLSWQTLVFWRESPLVNGEHVGGAYELPMPVRLGRVLAVALGGTVPAELELELGGSPTGLRVVLPAAAANAPVEAEANLGGVLVSAGTRIRWKCVSGGEDIGVSHWHLQLTLATSRP